jgi:hypothetical protein
MPTNNFLPFASGTGANVWSDATYAGSSQQQTGIQKGIVPSGLMSKAWRQSAAGSAVMGQIITAYGLVDAVDDGNITGLAATYRTALAAMLAGVAFANDTSATANTIVAAIDPVPPTITTYRGIFIRVANTNTSGVTLSLNSLGAKNVVKKNGSPLSPGDIIAGQFTHFLYDLAGGQWVLAGAAPSDTTSSVQKIFATTQKITFTATTTYSVPNGVTSIFVERCQGAGGAGGGSATSTAGSIGAGGGGGETKSGWITVAPGQQVVMTVGTGGTATGISNNGNAGGSSSVGAYMTAAGGGGGLGSTSGIAASGGAGGNAGGNNSVPGSNGGTGIYTSGNVSLGGAGAASLGSSYTGPNNLSAGNAGVYPGGGGSGASGGTGFAGAGANGRIEIWIFGATS